MKSTYEKKIEELNKKLDNLIDNGKDVIKEIEERVKIEENKRLQRDTLKQSEIEIINVCIKNKFSSRKIDFSTLEKTT